MIAVFRSAPVRAHGRFTVLTIAEALREACRAVPAGEARALLRHVLECDESFLIARAERTLTPGQREAYVRLAARRAAGEPLAYLTGEREFYGLSFNVTPAVLIPRPETELLVELALERLPGEARARVLDLGTGSGCVAIAIAREQLRAEIVAVDASAQAVALARDNARRHGVRGITVLHGDWFGAVPGQRFDVIVANPPYVAAGDPHLGEGDLRFEPRGALVAGPTGFECIEAIIASAPRHLVRGGWLLFEHGMGQAPRCRALLAHAGLGAVFTRADLAGIERVSGARSLT